MTRSALCILTLALAALPAFAQSPQPAGRVLLAVGEVVAERGGQPVPLALNAPVFEGDTLRLGPASNAQVRMSDQSVVALRERTVFRIDEYRYAGGEEGRGVFSLLAGGMRTVTGVIGRAAGQRGNYAVKTPTSTIGIRGTHYTLVHCDNDCGNASTASALLARVGGETMTDAGLQLAQAGGPRVPNGTYGGVTDGRINAAPNEAPQLGRDFGHDEYFYVASAKSSPQSLIAPPSFLHDRLAGQSRSQGQRGSTPSDTLAQGGINAESRPNSVPEGPKPSTFVVTEQKTSTGASAVVSAVPTYALMGSFRGGNGYDNTGGALVTPGMLTVLGSGSGQYVASVNIPAGTRTSEGVVPAPGITGTLTGSVADLYVGSTTNILMGRWTGGSFTDDTGTSSLPGGLHFIYGPLTPPDAIAARTGTLNFTGVAGTTPTHSGGQSFLGGGPSTTLQVNFTNRTVTLPASSFSFSPQSWSLPSATANITIVQGIGAGFDVGRVSGGSCVGTGCSGTVSMTATGVFLGSSSSQHLGVVYGATNSALQTINGAKLYLCSGC